mmetsp:Transcript_109046/g.260165  ORF Transcript_109046/g.260165 Transcript_109046/m.260165 type:complete len:210 (-) Transcript_109046:265-894(-)
MRKISRWASCSRSAGATAGSAALAGAGAAGAGAAAEGGAACAGDEAFGCCCLDLNSARYLAHSSTESNRIPPLAWQRSCNSVKGRSRQVSKRSQRASRSAFSTQPAQFRPCSCSLAFSSRIVSPSSAFFAPERRLFAESGVLRPFGEAFIFSFLSGVDFACASAPEGFVFSALGFRFSSEFVRLRLAGVLTGEGGRAGSAGGAASRSSC